MTVLTNDVAVARVEPALGGRLASLVVRGTELLVTGAAHDHPMMWGSFPMVPWAGRIRGARFSFDGREHELPANLAPHAIHGTGYVARWHELGDGTLRHDFDAAWPFGGYALQRFALDDRGLTCTLEVHAERPMPAMVGWHPWFRRPVELTFAAASMYRRDGDGIASVELITAPPGPWDDCFTGVDAPPQLTWPDGPTVTITSSCDHWVVYDEPSHALCVEPQSGPPDEFNLRGAQARIVRPGRPFVAWMRLSWS